MTKTFRFGVGTALICFSLMLLPWTSVWLSGLPFDSKEPVLHDLIEVLVRDVVPMALLLAFVIGICSALRFVFTQKWRLLLQPSIEMLVCFGAFIVIPAY